MEVIQSPLPSPIDTLTMAEQFLTNNLSPFPCPGDPPLVIPCYGSIPLNWCLMPPGVLSNILTVALDISIPTPSHGNRRIRALYKLLHNTGCLVKKRDFGNLRNLLVYTAIGRPDCFTEMSASQFAAAHDISVNGLEHIYVLLSASTFSFVQIWDVVNFRADFPETLTFCGNHFELIRWHNEWSSTLHDIFRLDRPDLQHPDHKWPSGGDGNPNQWIVIPSSPELFERIHIVMEGDQLPLVELEPQHTFLANLQQHGCLISQWKLGHLNLAITYYLHDDIGHDYLYSDYQNAHPFANSKREWFVRLLDFRETNSFVLSIEPVGDRQSFLANHPSVKAFCRHTFTLIPLGQATSLFELAVAACNLYNPELVPKMTLP